MKMLGKTTRPNGPAPPLPPKRGSQHSSLEREQVAVTPTTLESTYTLSLKVSIVRNLLCLL